MVDRNNANKKVLTQMFVIVLGKHVSCQVTDKFMHAN